ncbi:hypothetical protein DFP72DRAFT_483659 [Ephemerocybe angulata]|uniref:Uncharacterized protein n=1 Tax=Ephemerocybe angulata TaxID=980116 RepID=A0A8H6MFC6_9AGAR|nr:hypothetical protein DFP72DRAFT_483659 [Tulosesus angulatus]
MTEYTISPQAYREFMSARERTAYWVQQYHPEEVYSPSTGPTDLDGFVPPSPAMSTASLPPKMVLRYNDGRGDIPIPRPAGGAPGARSNPKYRQQSYNSHHPNRSGSHHASSPLAGVPSPHGDREFMPPPTPEQIHILPSRSSNPSSNSPTSPSSQRPSHNRSKSVPRRDPELDVPFIAPPVPRSHPPQHNGQAPYSPWISGRHGSNSKQPPSIVYAPGRHHGPNYDPPLLLHHQPQMGPNGMMYSHSAPPVLGGGPQQYPGGHHGYSPTHAEEERMGRSADREFPRRPMRGRQQPMKRNGSSESLGSQESGSTYYVLPSAGQKVHVIAASPERSIETASSSTKGPSSPYSQASSGHKKPFFGRLLARFASPAPSKDRASDRAPDGRRLHRRHSFGASGRPKLVEQRA